MQEMETTYHFGLVLLSFAVAIFASFVTLNMVESLSSATGRSKKLWLLAGALAMGCGIWSMHFIGMLAFEMPGMTMSYDIKLMSISIAVAILGSMFALSIMSRKTLSNTALVMSAFAMAAAIAGMHYIGMYSMRMPAMIEWDATLVGLSLLIALAASFCALIVAARLPTAQNPLRVQTSASVLLGVAIAGMHYTGMQAAHFHHVDIAFDSTRSVLASSALTTLVVVSTLLILALALGSSTVERLLTRKTESVRVHARKAKAAEASNALKTRFLANMSHEIRTPLAAIIGYTELVLEEPLDKDQREAHLKTVLRSARALLRLLDDILDLSKIEMNKLEVEKHPFALRPFLDEIQEMLRIKSDAKGLSLKFSVETELPERVVSDSTRLRQILVNLVGNAIKFTSAGTVEVKAYREGEMLSFQIQDTGIGLTAEQASRLFQPFTQADSSTTREFGGTGLGLDISRRLANALGGTVQIVQSAPHKGTTFLATVQLETPDKKSAHAQLSSPLKPLSELDQLRVLLVDDNQDNQLLISRILKRRGATVTTASDGRIGVETARAQDFDVILMDIQMPVMNGYDAIRELRASGDPTPIVALTAHALKEERDACFANGCNGYLTKPVDAGELVSALQRYRPSL